MRTTCQEAIEEYLANLKQGFSCVTSAERIRIITPYLYPDNDLIEVFIEELPSGLVRATDLGETLRHLHARGFDPFESPKRKFMVETIASRVGVELIRGQLTKTSDMSELGDLLFDIIVTARGISDLIYTSKTYEPATFLDEVDQFFKANQLPVESSIKLTGITGRVYTAHFKVISRLPRFIQTLSPVAAAGLKPKVDATFRMWSDCNHNLARECKVTLLNDVDFEWRIYDVRLLDTVSIVHYWKRKDELLYSLRAVLQ